MTSIMEIKFGVALTTFNGTKYLKEQLDSIAKQTIPIYHLVISCDNKCQKTKDIVSKFNDRFFKLSYLENTKDPLGVCYNVEKAINHLSKDCEWIFLSDHDDYWKESKVELYLDYIKKSTISMKFPALIYSDPIIWNGDKNLLKEAINASNNRNSSFMKSRHLKHPDKTKNPFFFQNMVTGATALFNRAMIKQCMPFPRPLWIHDWWFASCAYYYGQLFFLDEPNTFYRMENQNLIGGKPFYHPHSFFNALKINKNASYYSYCIEQAHNLSKLSFPQKQQNLLQNMEKISRRGGSQAILFFHKNHLWPQGFLRKIRLILLFLINKRNKSRLQETLSK